MKIHIKIVILAIYILVFTAQIIHLSYTFAGGTLEKVLVYAEVPWEASRVITRANSILQWSVNDDDLWSFNSAVFPNGHNANGIENIPALRGYVFPGENLGRLIGRIGGIGRLISMGTSGETIIRHDEGGNYLYLTINDEITQIYGKGFKDNLGCILVNIVQVPKKTLKIELIYYKYCHGFKYALENLEEVIREEEIDEPIFIIKLTNKNEAKDFQLAGSPTIRINNKDIDSTLKKTSELGVFCRVYDINGEKTVWPGKELIRNAIKNALENLE